MPKNVSLKVLDVLGRIPDELVERFDVVHIRTFATIVKDSDPMPLLKNLVRMLSRVSPLIVSRRSSDNCLYADDVKSRVEPGGFLQWDELDCATFSAHAPNKATEKKHCEELVKTFELVYKKQGIEYGSVDAALPPPQEASATSKPH